MTHTLDERSTITYGNAEVATYSYDTRSRPTRILVMSGKAKRMDLNYTYGDTGKRLRMVQGGTTTTYTYGKFNRLTKAVTGATTVTNTYDANGNLATKNDGTYLWTFIYDYENRLTKVQQGSTTMEQMVYDGDGKAIQNIQSSTVVSLWTGFDIIYQKNGRVLK